MPIHTGVSAACPAGVLPHIDIKAITKKLASTQAAVLLYSCLLCTVMWKQTLSCEHPTGYKPNSATIT